MRVTLLGLCLGIAVIALAPAASAATCSANCTSAGGSTTVSCDGGTVSCQDNVGCESTTIVSCGPSCTITTKTEKKCGSGGNPRAPENPT